MQKTKLNTWFFCSMILVVIGLGLFIRLWQLNTIPPGMQYDEAYNGLDAIKAMQSGDYKMFYPENAGREGLYINLIALSFKLFGVSSFTLLLVSAILGTLTIVGFFLLLEELKFSKLAVFLGTFMLASSFWHLNFSRIAYRGIMVPMLLVWIFYFFLKGVGTKKNKFLFFALSGLLLGLGFHTYIAFRVTPLIIIFLTISLALSQKDFIRQYWQSALVFFFAAFIAALPIFIYFINHQADLVGRANAVSILNAPNMSVAQAFGKSLLYHLGAFFVHGDPNQRHNFNGQPEIPPAWSVLLALGFLISLKEIFTTLYRLIKSKKSSEQKKLRSFSHTKYFTASVIAQATFWIMLIPGVMSIEGIPHALRIIGTIPAVFLFAALPFEYSLRLLSRIKKSPTLALKPWRWNLLKISIGGMALITVLSGLSQIYIYFDIWAKEPQTADAFERKIYDLGLLIRQLPTKQNNYIITKPDTSISPDKKDSALKSAQFQGYPKTSSYLFMHPFDGRFEISCENPQVIFFEADQWLLDQYKEECKSLSQQEITPQGGIYSFWVLN